MILAIDGNNHMHADWHGAKDQAGSVFVRRVNAMRERFKPNQVIVAWDNSEPTFRHELFPDYKAGRKEHEPSLMDQIDQAICLLFATCDCVSVAGFEADDIIATVVADRGNDKVVIASTDKDLRQLLVDGEVTILRKWNNGEPEWFTAKRLFEEYGLVPEQWIDWLTLVGDASDNIKGIDGIGEKGATALLANGTMLDDILLNPWSFDLTTKKRDAILAFASRLEATRKLLTLRNDVPLELTQSQEQA
jgi:DNA polymerase-1